LYRETLKLNREFVSIFDGSTRPKAAEVEFGLLASTSPDCRK